MKIPKKILSVLLAISVMSSMLSTFASANELKNSNGKLNATANYEPFVYPSDNSLGSVSDFAVFSKDYKHGGDMEGNVAVKKFSGGATLGNTNHNDPTTGEKITDKEHFDLSYIGDADGLNFHSANPLILGSTFKAQNRNGQWFVSHNGGASYFIGNQSDVTNVYIDEKNKPYINFDTAFTKLIDYSSFLTSLTEKTVTSTGDNFTYTCKDGLNVINMSVSAFSQNRGFINFANLKKGSMLIINLTDLNDKDVSLNRHIQVNGKDTDWMIDGGRVLFNFGTFDKVASFGETKNGLILAPQATVTINSAHNGAVIAPTVNGNAEIHRIPYDQPVTDPVIKVSKTFAFGKDISDAEKATLRKNLELDVLDKNNNKVATLKVDKDLCKIDNKEIVKAIEVSNSGDVDNVTWLLTLKTGGTYSVVDHNNADKVVYTVKAEYIKGVPQSPSDELTLSPETPATNNTTSEVAFKNTYNKIIYGETPASIKILKVDSKNDKKALGGAEFKVCKDKDCKIPVDGVAPVITDKNGKATIAGLKGTKDGKDTIYYLIETKAPTDYVASDTNYTIQLSSSKVESTDKNNIKTITTVWKATVNTMKNGVLTPVSLEDGILTVDNTKIKEVNDEIPASISIKKIDTVSKNALSGAEFTLYSDESCKKIIRTLPTAADGTVSFTGLKGTKNETKSTLYFKETKAPDNHALSSKVYQVNLTSKTSEPVLVGNIRTTTKTWSAKIVDSQNSDITIENKEFEEKVNSIPDKLSITKIDSKDKDKVLSGATFKVFKDKDGKIPVDNVAPVITDKDGNATINGLKGTDDGKETTYYLKEISAPNDYVLKDTSYQINLTSKITDVKTDDTTATRTTTLTWTAKFDENNSSSLTISNVEYDHKTNNNPASIKIKKIDSKDGNKVLSGAEFTVFTDKDCKIPYSKVISTDKDGFATFDNLIGTQDGKDTTYYLKETKAPDDYALSKDIKPYVINLTSISKTETSDNVITTTYSWSASIPLISDGILTIENTQFKPDNKTVPASIEINKVDSDGKTPLSGAEFMLAKDKDFSDIIDCKITADGKVTFDNLKGTDDLKDTTYYLKETLPPENYVLSKQVYEVTLKAKSVTTYDNKNAIKLTTVTWTATFADSGNNSTTITNTHYNDVDAYKPASIEISKVDSDSKASLNGAEFTLYSDKDCNNIIATKTTSDGKAKFDELYGAESGEDTTYYLKETKAPENYILSNTVYNVNLTRGRAVITTDDTTGVRTSTYTWSASIDSMKDSVLTVPNTRIREENKKAPASFEISKIDKDNNNLLNGADFTLYSDKDCNNIIATKTTSDGKVTFDGLYGSDDLKDTIYYLKETKAPLNYVLDSTVYPITLKSSSNTVLNDEGTLKTTTVTWSIANANVINGVLTVSNTKIKEENKKVPVSFEISKVDKDNNNPLNGADFTLYSDKDCNNIIATKTTSDGKVTFDGLYGSDDLKDTIYYLKETKAPENYVLDSTVYPITLKSSSNTVLNDEGTLKTTTVTWSIANANVINGVLTVSNTKIKEENKKIPASFEISKVDKDSKAPLNGAGFTLYSDKDCNNIIATKTTSDGKVTFDGLYGSDDLKDTIYYLKETKAPLNYVLDSTVYPITLKSSSNTVLNDEGTLKTTTVTWSIANINVINGVLTVSNTKIREEGFEVPDTVSILKIDSVSKATLNGAEFTLFSDNTCKNAIKTITTDKNGKASFDNLSGNAYSKLYIKETKAPTGYKLNDKVYTVDLSSVARAIVENGVRTTTITWEATVDGSLDGILTVEDSKEDIPPEDIPPDDVPKDAPPEDTPNTPTENIPDQPIPLAPKPTETIEDVPTPLTGDNNSDDSNMPLIASLCSLSAVIGLAYLHLLGKKKKEDND